MFLITLVSFYVQPPCIIQPLYQGTGTVKVCPKGVL